MQLNEIYYLRRRAPINVLSILIIKYNYAIHFLEFWHYHYLVFIILITIFENIDRFIKELDYIAKYVFINNR